jgi:hypothetical protein
MLHTADQPIGWKWTPSLWLNPCQKRMSAVPTLRKLPTERAKHGLAARRCTLRLIVNLNSSNANAWMGFLCAARECLMRPCEARMYFDSSPSEWIVDATLFHQMVGLRLPIDPLVVGLFRKMPTFLSSEHVARSKESVKK